MAAQPSAAAVKPAVTTTASPFATLRPQHPRLFALDADIAAVRELLKAHPAWYESLKKAGEAVISHPPVEHKLEGPRLLTQSRAALDRITLLGFLHRVQPSKRYVDRAVLEMETAAAFPDWNPSHFLDTAEMTNALALGYDWFYADLSPETRTRVRTAIVNLGLKEGLKIYAKKPRWINGHNNWNQVCNGGMIIGALAIADEEPQVASEVFAIAKESLGKGMELFAPDGGWLEAASYWMYTMKYTASVLSAMHTALGTAYGLDEVPGFSNTGNFILAMEGPTGKFFNWGDCGEAAGNIPEMFWLARRFKNPYYAWVGTQHMGNNPGAWDLLWHTPAQSPVGKLGVDWYFKGIDAMTMREAWANPRASFVGFKGGDNTTPHSNHDLGTFVFDTDGERWAIDLGGDNYNLPGYWNPDKRLDYYRIRTEGQNTLTLNGGEQGKRAKAKIDRMSSKPDRSMAIVDLSAAYKKEASSVTRGFMLAGNRRHLVIQDELVTDAPVDLKWHMHTRAKVTVNGKTATLTQGNATAFLTVVEPANATLSVESAEQQPPQQANKGISRVVIKTKTPAGASRVIVKLSPGSAPTFNYIPQPLDNW